MGYYHRVTTHTELLKLKKELNMSGDTHAHSIVWDGGVCLYTPNGSKDEIVLSYENDKELIDLLIGERLLGDEYDYENDRCVTMSELQNVTSLGKGLAGRIVKKQLEQSTSTITDLSVLEKMHNLRDISGSKGNTYKGMFAMVDLKKVRLPQELEEIGMAAFAFCLRLDDIIIPENVKTIKKNAFYNCASLISIEIPENVETIETGAFSNAASLNEVIMKGSTPPSLGTDVFNKVGDGFTIYVPKGAKSAYTKAWTAYSKYIKENKNNSI